MANNTEKNANTANTAKAKARTEKEIMRSANAYPGEKLVRVRIPQSKEEEGDVFVSVNDRNWYIKRGAEVEIPECAASVLLRREERIADALAYEDRVTRRSEG